MFKAELIGNLGADAERRQGNDGMFVSFRVASTRKWTNRQTGEIIENTTWVSCTLNGDGGGVFQYLKAGEKVFIRGELSTRLYIGQDGQKHAGVNVSVEQIELVGQKSKLDFESIYKWFEEIPERAEHWDEYCKTRTNPVQITDTEPEKEQRKK